MINDRVSPPGLRQRENVIRVALNTKVDINLLTDLRRYADDLNSTMQDVVEAAVRSFMTTYPLDAAVADDPAPPAAGGADGVSEDGTGVSLPIALVGRLRARSRESGRSYTDLVLDAVEATHEQLAELLVPQRLPSRTGPLFAGRAPAAGRWPGAGRQQVNLRFSVDDLGVIDGLVDQVTAPSRSAMLAAALDAFLPAGEAATGQG